LPNLQGILNHDLFPDIEPYASEYLNVGDGHELYLEQCGRASGVPILVVHGGPGSGCTPIMRRFFDPDHYRIILFDQRGANRSRPLASLHENTPDKLVADIEKIRTHLGIEKFLFPKKPKDSCSLLSFYFSRNSKATLKTFPGRYYFDWSYKNVLL